MLDKGTFLQPLADRFVRLALQLLARYASWLSAGLEQAPSRAPQAPDDGLQQSEGLEQVGSTGLPFLMSVVQLHHMPVSAALERKVKGLSKWVSRRILLSSTGFKTRSHV